MYHVIKGHKVIAINVLVHLCNWKVSVVLRTGGCRNVEVEVIAVSVLCSVLIVHRSAQLECLDKIFSICLIFRVLPVNVKSYGTKVSKDVLCLEPGILSTIETKISDQPQRRLRKAVACSVSSQSSPEVVSVRPAADRKNGLQVAVLLLELEQLVEVTQQLCTG